MSIITIKQLSIYQIEQLRAYFTLSAIENVGVIIETGEVIIEYTPMYQEGPARLQTAKIPAKNPNIKVQVD